MRKKTLNLTVFGAVMAAMLLLINMNAMAYKIDDKPAEKIVTDLSDRSLIKEALLNQKQMLALLKDIKGSCQAK